MKFRCCRSLVRATVLVSVAATPLRAQRDTVPLFTHRDLLVGSAAIGATLAIAPFDHRISNWFTGPAWRSGRPRQRAAGDIAILGGNGPFVISAALYAAGRIDDRPALTRVAVHGVEAVLLGGGIAGVIRGFTGRALPNVSTREEFSFGRGFHDNNGPFVSFPSGHTTAAFAMAATISGEVRRDSPRLARAVTPLVYSLATAVGIARVAQRDHWPTDLPLAFAIGTWSGEAVDAHADHWRWLRRATRGIMLAPAPRGRAIIAWSWRAPDAAPAG